jgi:hypothetical protein
MITTKLYYILLQKFDFLRNLTINLIKCCVCVCVFCPPPPPMAQQPSSAPGPSHYWAFTITFRHNTLGRTPLYEWSARRRDLYVTTHNTHKRQTSMPPMGFEPTIPARERPQTNALHCAATGIGKFCVYRCVFRNYILQGVCGLRQCGRYSDLLLARRSGDQIPVKATFSATVQTVPGTYPASTPGHARG